MNMVMATRNGDCHRLVVHVRNDAALVRAPTRAGAGGSASARAKHATSAKPIEAPPSSRAGALACGRA